MIIRYISRRPDNFSEPRVITEVKKTIWIRYLVIIGVIAVPLILVFVRG